MRLWSSLVFSKVSSDFYARADFAGSSSSSSSFAPFLLNRASRRESMFPKSSSERERERERESSCSLLLINWTHFLKRRFGIGKKSAKNSSQHLLGEEERRRLSGDEDLDFGALRPRVFPAGSNVVTHFFVRGGLERTGRAFEAKI